MIPRALTAVAVAATFYASPMAAQQDTIAVLRNDSVIVRLVDTDLRLAVQALAQYLDKPVIFGAIGEFRVTLATAEPVPRTAVPALLEGMLRSHGLELQEESDYYRVGAPDQAPATEGAPTEVQLFVIRLRHARAADVAATVNALYGQASALGEIPAPRPSLAESLRENLVPPADVTTADRPAPVVQAVAELAGQVTIIPDARTNSLLIRASARDFALVAAAVEQLDVRPLQVLIEVVIAEVRRDRGRAAGLEAILPASRVPGASRTEAAASTAGLGLGDFVLEIMNLAGSDLALTLHAAASRGEVSILSRPVVLAANNEAAEILVGSQRPFVQVQRALPTESPVRDQVVQFKDVGTRLTVVPTVSEDGYVMLQVAQEVNAATAEVAFDAPVISTRSLQTQLLIKDGHTAVLGGLADRQHDETRSGVPVLSDIPLIGALFGKRITRTTETELFIFLTPRVIADDDDLREVSDSIGDRTRAVRRRQH